MRERGHIDSGGGSVEGEEAEESRFGAFGCAFDFSWHAGGRHAVESAPKQLPVRPLQFIGERPLWFQCGGHQHGGAGGPQRGGVLVGESSRPLRSSGDIGVSLSAVASPSFSPAVSSRHGEWSWYGSSIE